VFGAFVFLVGTTFRNRLFQRIRRLRHPRYLIGLAFGVFYIWTFFLRPYSVGVPARVRGTGLGLGDLPIRLASLALVVFVARWWLFESGTPVLAFAPAEVQFLFPAPLRRRDLLTFKLITAQLQLLISAAVISIFASRWDPSMAAPLRLFGAWVLLVTLYLHHLGASLVRVGVMHTRPGTKRPFLAVAIAFGVATIILVGLARAWAPVVGPPGVRGLLDAAGVALRSPLLAAVLWPFRAALAPLFASSRAEWARGLAVALPLLAAHYVWVLRIDVPFEEAAADASAALAERIRAMRQRMLGGAPIDATSGQSSRRRRAWFALRSGGQPWVAIVWKNMIALQRGGWRSVWTTAAFVIAIAAIVMSGQGPLGGSASLAFAGGAAGLAWTLAVVGPVAFQNDLRRDVAYLAVLRTYPLSGVRIVFASVASSVLPLLIAQLLLIALACVICPAGVGEQPIGIGLRVALLGVSAVVLPPLDATSATIGNAMALLFPTARALGAAVGGAGAEGIGQVIVSRIASILGAVLAFVLPAAAAMLVYWVAKLVAAPSTATLLALPTFVAAYSSQLYAMIRWVGRVFDRTDAVAVSAVD
jgi:hypothetical protein